MKEITTLNQKERFINNYIKKQIKIKNIKEEDNQFIVSDFEDNSMKFSSLNFMEKFNNLLQASESEIYETSTAFVEEYTIQKLKKLEDILNKRFPGNEKIIFSQDEALVIIPNDKGKIIKQYTKKEVYCKDFKQKF